MQEGAGPDVGVRLDLNFNFKPEGYRQVTTELDDLDLTWIEIDLYDPIALAAIRERIATRLRLVSHYTVLESLDLSLNTRQLM